MPDVSDDADDLDPVDLFLAGPPDARADGARAGEVLSDEASFTTPTSGAPSRSDGERSRPAFRGMPITPK